MALAIARPYCLNKNCTCHTPTVDSWDEFDEVCRKMEKEVGPSVDYNPDPIKDFIKRNFISKSVVREAFLEVYKHVPLNCHDCINDVENNLLPNSTE